MAGFDRNIDIKRGEVRLVQHRLKVGAISKSSANEVCSATGLDHTVLIHDREAADTDHGIGKRLQAQGSGGHYRVLFTPDRRILNHIVQRPVEGIQLTTKVGLDHLRLCRQVLLLAAAHGLVFFK
ncbi:hypothetical protein D3C72_2081880 [compost metagenome]